MNTWQLLGFIVRGWIDALTERRREIRFWAGYLLVAGLLWLVFMVIVPGVIYKGRTARAKQNLHAVQLALERFAVDTADGTYPYDINDVITAGYLEEFPRNPFTRRPMQVLQPGAEIPPGDFIYHIRPDQSGRIAGYTLELNY